jgi:hypothetical protein
MGGAFCAAQNLNLPLLSSDFSDLSRKRLKFHMFFVAARRPDLNCESPTSLAVQNEMG